MVELHPCMISEASTKCLIEADIYSRNTGCYPASIQDPSLFEEMLYLHTIANYAVQSKNRQIVQCSLQIMLHIFLIRSSARQQQQYTWTALVLNEDFLPYRRHLHSWEDISGTDLRHARNVVSFGLDSSGCNSGLSY